MQEWLFFLEIRLSWTAFCSIVCFVFFDFCVHRHRQVFKYLAFPAAVCAGSLVCPAGQCPRLCGLQVLDGLKDGNAALKRMHDLVSIDEIERIMDETQEGVEKQQVRLVVCRRY